MEKNETEKLTHVNTAAIMRAIESLTPQAPIGPPEPASPPGEIHGAIARIMGEVGGVAKGRRNQSQGYAFRGIADIYLACQPLMAKHSVHMVPHAVLEESVTERPTKSGGTQLHVRMRVQFRFYHADGSWIQAVATGEAMDSGDKASGKAMSYAAKYALIQVFALPEEDPEIDTEARDPEPLSPKATARPPAPTTPPVAAADVRDVDRNIVEHPAVTAAKAAFPGARDATYDRVNRVMRLTQLAMKKKPDGMGWTKTGATGWIKKHFGRDGSAGMTDAQIEDAILLLSKRVTDGEEVYREGLRLMASEGRCLFGPDAPEAAS